ncbi:MAG: ribosome-associated translation inhibitor RaiA [Patescibacteria group bacterium]|mgnify:FL=1
MNITISGKDFKLSPAIKQYVEGKMSKLEKFNHHIQRIGIELDVDHNVAKGKKNRVEVWVTVPGGTIQAGIKAEHMREAIDLVYPVIERRLVRDKEIRRSKAIRRRQH